MAALSAALWRHSATRSAGRGAEDSSSVSGSGALRFSSAAAAAAASGGAAVGIQKDPGSEEELLSTSSSRSSTSSTGKGTSKVKVVPLPAAREGKGAKRGEGCGWPLHVRGRHCVPRREHACVATPSVAMSPAALHSPSSEVTVRIPFMRSNSALVIQRPSPVPTFFLLLFFDT